MKETIAVPPRRIVVQEAVWREDGGEASTNRLDRRSEGRVLVEREGNDMSESGVVGSGRGGRAEGKRRRNSRATGGRGQTTARRSLTVQTPRFTHATVRVRRNRIPSRRVPRCEARGGMHMSSMRARACRARRIRGNAGDLRNMQSASESSISSDLRRQSWIDRKHRTTCGERSGSGRGRRRRRSV